MFGAVKGLTHFGFILIDFVQGPFCVRKYPSQNVLCQCRMAFLRLVKQIKIKNKKVNRNHFVLKCFIELLGIGCGILC